MRLYDLWLLAVARRRLRAAKLLGAAGFRLTPRDTDPTRPVLHAVEASRARDLQQRLELAGGAAHVVHVGEQHIAVHAAAPMQRPAVRLRRIERALELRRGLLGQDELQRDLRQHRSTEAARAALASELRRLRRRGYLLMDCEADVFARIDRARQAEATRGAIAARDRPLDDAARLVRGDQLLERGDPRGTLVALQAAQQLLGSSEPQNTRQLRREALGDEQSRLLKCFGGALLGELSRFPNKVQIDWRLGLVDRLRLGNGYLRGEPTIDDATARLVARHICSLPLVASLRALEIEAPYAAPLVDTLGDGTPPRCIEQLSICDQHGSWLGDVGALCAKLPALRELSLRGVPQLRGLHAPELRELSLQTQALHPRTLEALGCATLPRLESLTLWLRPAPAWRLDYDVLAPLLSRRSAPRLRRLAVWFCSAPHELLRRLSGSALLAELRELDLRGCAPFDCDGEWLLAHASELEHLQRIELDAGYLSSDACATLRRRFGARLQTATSGQVPLPFAPPWVALRRIEQLDRSLRC